MVSSETKLDKSLKKMNPTAKNQSKEDQRHIWQIYNKLNISTQLQNYLHISMTVTCMGSDPKWKNTTIYHQSEKLLIVTFYAHCVKHQLLPFLQGELFFSFEKL